MEFLQREFSQIKVLKENDSLKTEISNISKRFSQSSKTLENVLSTDNDKSSLGLEKESYFRNNFPEVKDRLLQKPFRNIHKILLTPKI